MANASREILVPFQIGPHGGIAYTENPVNQAIQRIISIVRTQLGERVMLPALGSPVSDYIWEPNNEITAAELAMRVTEAINQWEQAAVLRSVQPVSLDPQSGVISLEIKFSVPPRGDVFSTLVGVGGSITGEQHG